MPIAPEAPYPRAASATEWAREHESKLLLMLAGLGVILRVLLAIRSPTPYGYVFDFYHQAIQKLYTLGHLPSAADCWQCYHPPLLPLLGLPFYALGKTIMGGPAVLNDPALRFIAPISLVCGAATAWNGYRILRWYRFSGIDLVLGTGLILAFPCLFISSYGIEADILLTALMTAFFFHLLEFLHPRQGAGTGSAIRLGALAGLACATKYTGLVAPAILIALSGLHLIAGQHRLLLARRASIALVICVALGSWKYVDNWQRYHTLLFANGSAQQGFAVSNRPSFWRQYDFHSLRLGELWRLTHGQVPPGDLTNLPFYRSVWTTLHAMAWGDMGVFSDPSRHGFYRKPYSRKALDPTLAFSVLLLGLVPSGLAAAGFLVTIGRRVLWPLAVSSLLTLAAYVWWFLAQESWALKTKYILFLLPAYVVYALLGLRWVRRLSRPCADVVVLLLAVLIVVAHLYLLDFAWS
jgi:4-amino-4-deoxy-L-arabinose transferase-like glycosyltransferase